MFQVGVIGVGSIPLYVVAGQSNAVRIVQSGAIESTLDDRGAGELSIVTAAVGRSLYPDYTYTDFYSFDDGDANTGELYRDLIDAINAELAANSEVYLAGVFWIQGEEDANSATYGPDYYTNLNELYQNLTEIYGGEFDFVISALSTYADAADVEPAWDEVRQAQEDLANAYDHVYLIDPDDLIDVEGYTEGQIFTDDVHYTQIAYEWLADSFFDLFPIGGNTAPDAKADSVATNEDTPLSGNVLADNGNGADSDIDGQSLTVSTTPVSGVSHGVLVLNANGSFSYTPTANFSGTDSFTYQLSDGHGGTDTGVVTITVAAVNDAPDARADSFSTSEGTQLGGNVLSNNGSGADSDVDGNSLTVNTTPVSGVSNGVLVLNANGSFSYTPTANFNGTDSFTYRVSDGQGGTDTAVVTISVAAVNGDPVAADDGGYATAYDTPLVIAASALLANDSDGDPELTQTLTLTAVSGAVNGTVALSGGVVTFTPTPGYTGSAQFTYTLSDGAGGTDTATVTLTVADNEAPTAANDEIAVDEDSIVTGNVLDNDDDPEGRELTAVLLSGPMQGVLTFAADGSFAYEADADLFDLATPGTVIEQTFAYQVSDGDGGVDQATATLFVTILDDGGTFHAGDSTPNVATGTDGGEDLVLGGAGDDALYGLDGADTIRGDDGDDRLYGGESADRLYGEAGNDRLYGEDGADVLKGAGDDDRLDGGSGDDILRGGSGDDRLLGRAGDDTLNGGSGADAMDGGSGDDLLRGWTGNDRIKGAAGADTLKGEDGDDRIKGGSGGDLIKGGSGRDQIEGGEGLDTLIGGAGSDRFVFALGEGADEVLDFTDGQDLLVMRGLDFAELSITQSGNDTTISVEGAVVAVLLDTEVSALTARDFLF